MLEGITDFNEYRQNDERFSAVVAGMNMNNNMNMKIACLQLTNAIISTPDDLDFRIHLRNEFWRAGLVDLVEVQYTNSREVCSLSHMFDCVLQLRPFSHNIVRAVLHHS